jgi:hypothetical protein
MSSLISTGTLPGAIQSASAAINRGVTAVNRDAAAVASASVAEPGEVLPALIDSRQQQLYVQAAARLMSTADQMLGTLIDIHA